MTSTLTCLCSWLSSVLLMTLFPCPSLDRHRYFLCIRSMLYVVLATKNKSTTCNTFMGPLVKCMSWGPSVVVSFDPQCVCLGLKALLIFFLIVLRTLHGVSYLSGAQVLYKTYQNALCIFYYYCTTVSGDVIRTRHLYG